MQQQKGSGSGSEIGVTWEDQLNINKFGRLNNRFHELEDEIKIAKVCELNAPVVDKLLGTIVHNEKEAYDLYNYYAHHIGFSIRKDHVSYWPNTKNIKSKDFLCSKAGLKRTPNLNSKVKFQKSDIRTGCAAMIRFVVDIDDNWTVKKFIEIHNHSLANPVDHHLLRSNRSISEEKAAMLKSMTEAGIRATDAFSYLVEEVGGVENVGFSKRDAFNFIQKERRARIENEDTNALIQLFKERQAEDNMFAWDVQIDKSDKLLNFFWSDGLARVDYDCFGDVIIFDTSYRLNKYNLVCAPFVGVNHHWQNILFGVAFLSEETIESFTWLFKTFLRVMDEKHPLTIFTDQDQAMARAIEVALPNTRHRLCQWHISKKLPSKDPTKMRLNGVSNARLKGQWEKRKRVNKKNKGQSPTLVDDIQSPIGTTFSIMPTCSSEENNESLEDASNELILSDEDIVRFQIGEVFAHMPREEVESRLENMKEDSGKELEKLEEEKESVVAQMADLKKVLYGKFKDSINLEED